MRKIFDDEPICEECRYFDWGATSLLSKRAICTREESFDGKSPITGAIYYKDCGHMREPDTCLVTKCGPEGKLFEPRPPKKSLLKSLFRKNR